MRGRSPFAGRLVPGRTGRTDGEPGVVLRAREGLRVLELAGAPAGTDGLATALAGCGLALPAPGDSVADERTTILWRAPGTWYLLTADAGVADRLRRQLADRVTELTGAFGVLELHGPATRALLAKGLPLDPDDPRHAPGRAFTGRIGQVGVTLHRLAPDGFRILVPRSLARFLLDWLEAAAAEFGLEVRA